MWVPLKLCGSPTYMLNVAMVCWTPPSRSATRTGWRIDLMPTLSIARRRVSAEPCTSGMAKLSGKFMKEQAPCERDCVLEDYRRRQYLSKLLIYKPRYRLLDAFGVEPAVVQQFGRIAMINEPVGQAELQRAAWKSLPLEDLEDTAACTSEYSILLHRD